MFWVDDQLEQRRDELRRYVAREVAPIAPVRYRRLASDAVQHDPAPAQPDLDDSSWPVIGSGEPFASRADELIWFRAEVAVPEHLSGRTLAIRLRHGMPIGAARGGPTVAESLLYLDGVPYHGVDANHALVPLPPELGRRRSFTLAIQAWSGRGQAQQLRWQDPELIWLDGPTEALLYDFDAIYRTIQTMDATAAARVELLKLAEQAILALDWTRPGSDGFYRSVARAQEITRAGLERLKGTEALKPAVAHVGHTHLDVAWLWTLDNVKLKTARTWATALRLMEQYPEFVWIQSQPQLYQYIKETQPHIWEQVKRRVAEGRWEADGGMWVEADCNISGGEALVRQFLHGIRFFRRELGVQCAMLWLPDVFGYAWALPQIIRKCGLRYFMTTKLSWSQFNHFPYDTFRWRGMDGTEVLTHFITTPSPGQAPDNWITTYNGMILPETVKGNWDRYQQKEASDETLSSFGFGDGGGGPTREMLELARRLEDMPGIPHVRLSRAGDFFRRLEERVANGARLPVWNGELYLEYHRGTYTSQAQQKRSNRKAEFLLHNAELYAAAAAALTGAPYPREALDEAWEIVLRNQFHDIIPGTAIREVYEDSAREYARAFSLGEEALREAIGRLAAAIDLPHDSLVVFNPTGFPRHDLVEVDLPPGLTPVDTDGEPLPRQGHLVYVRDVPANGYRAFRLAEANGSETAGRGPEGGEADAPGRASPRPRSARPPEAALRRGAVHDALALGAPPLVVTRRLIETPHFRIELGERGHIMRLFDKRHDREVLPPGRAANVLQAFEDKPLRWDAWDIDIYYQQKGHDVEDLVEQTVEETGPERGVLHLVWRFDDSTITQRLTVYARIPRIDFVTHVDWQQSQVLLKVAFPVDVHSTRATYEIQFGNVERPTHWNTSWDWARFETAGHKWADVSEGGYGVSLLNDCKYGYDVKDDVLRLTLIKSGIQPDPQADRGEHVFTYSLFPHAEDWFGGGTVEQGYRLNNPLLATVQRAQPRAARGAGPSTARRAGAGHLPAALSLVSCTAPHVMVETVKQAERGDGLVVRVYEFGNRRGPAELIFCRPVARAAETNLLEEEPQPVRPSPQDAHHLPFTIKPYEIKTFVVELA
jgi:alpha-mannosidase